MKFAVIGLGYFGSALAIDLSRSGHEVIAIDTNSEHLEAVEEIVVLAANADGTDLKALRQLGVSEVDAAIVAIGEGFEDSLMITAHCQTLKVKKVYVRVINQVHEHLLGLMRVTGKVRAESLAAAQFARQITIESVIRYFGIDAEHGIVEIEIPKEFHGMTLAETNFRRKFGLNVITIRQARHKGQPSDDSHSVDETEDAFTTTGTPSPETRLNSHDRLVVFGSTRDIDRFCKLSRHL